MKKKLIIIASMLLGLSLVTGCGCTKKEKETKTETKVNTNEEVVKDREVEKFKLTNTSLIYENGMSTLTTEVYNSSESTEHLKTFNIVVKDNNGEVMETLLGYIGDDIPAGETRTITSSTEKDLSKAASVEYTINR